MSEEIEGTVENGTRGQLVTAFYSGSAGARDRGEGELEIAYFGKLPKLRDDLGGTFNGQPITVDSVSMSINRVMVLVKATIVAE